MHDRPTQSPCRLHAAPTQLHAFAQRPPRRSHVAHAAQMHISRHPRTTLSAVLQRRLVGIGAGLLAGSVSFFFLLGGKGRIFHCALAGRHARGASGQGGGEGWRARWWWWGGCRPGRERGAQTFTAHKSACMGGIENALRNKVGYESWRKVEAEKLWKVTK